MYNYTDSTATCIKCGNKTTQYLYKSEKTGLIYKTAEALIKAEGLKHDNSNSTENSDITQIRIWSPICLCCINEMRDEMQDEMNAIKKQFQLTTTSEFQGINILEYKEVVTSQVFMGVNLFKDVFSGIRDIVGGRSKAIEQEFDKSKNILIKELITKAIDIDANAIVGLKIDFEDIGKTSGNAFMLLGIGTAVVLEGRQSMSEKFKKYKRIFDLIDQ